MGRIKFLTGNLVAGADCSIIHENLFCIPKPTYISREMAEEGLYDQVEIEDMEYDSDRKAFVYPCPCGDKFFITLV